MAYDAGSAKLQSTINMVQEAYKAATGKDLVATAAAGKLSLADPSRQVVLRMNIYDCIN